MGLSLDPLKVSSLCHLREFFHAGVASGLLIRELNLHPDFCKAAL